MKLWNKNSTTEDKKWSIPGWSWRRELEEVAHCLIISVLVFAVLALPLMYVFNTCFGSEPTADSLHEQPSKNISCSTNAMVGGGSNLPTDGAGEFQPVDPSTDSFKDPSKDPAMTPANASRSTRELVESAPNGDAVISEEDGSRAKGLEADIGEMQAVELPMSDYPAAADLVG